jgi:transcription antitermination protein NusB
MKNRSELREIIIKVLYQIYIYENSNISYDVDTLVKEQIELSNSFVTDTIKEIIKHNDELISVANKHLKDWDINRLGKVDKAIICLGIYELMYTDTPNIVCINEAVELSKKYSDEKVVKMINAVLDSVLHNEVENE